MLKKCKIIMLPTNQKTKYLMVYSDVEKTKGKLILNGLKNDEYKEYQNIYIISDDKIKGSDYCYSYKTNKIVKSTCDVSREANKNIGFWKKVIATTDKSLSQTNRTEIPQPSQQFIQKFVEEYNKGNIIADVLVEYKRVFETVAKGMIGHPEDDISWWNEKLKINPNDNTITIKKLKDSWNRKEYAADVKRLCNLLYFSSNRDVDFNTKEELDNWIDQNL